MKELKNIKNILFKVIAVIACAILVAECMPMPSFTKKAKASDIMYYVYFDSATGKFANTFNQITSIDFGTLEEADNPVIAILIENDYPPNTYTASIGSGSLLETPTAVNCDPSLETHLNLKDYAPMNVGNNSAVLTMVVDDGLTQQSYNLDLTYVYTYTYNFELGGDTIEFGQPIEYKFTTNDPRPGVGCKFIDVVTADYVLDNQGVYFPSDKRDICVEIYNDNGGSIDTIMVYTYFYLTISKAKGVFTLNSSQVYQGQELSIKEMKINDSKEGNADILNENAYELRYKVKGTADSTYTNEMPTEVGTYIVKPEMVNSASLIVDDYYAVNYEFPEVEFKVIEKIEGNASLSAANIVSGQKPKLTINSTTYDLDEIEIVYYDSNGNELSGEPVAPGKYTVKVIFNETEMYRTITKTAEFEVLYKSGSGNFTVNDTVYGQKINKSLTSSTNDASLATYSYKIKGAADSTYTSVEPVKPGTYIAKAKLPRTNYYESVELTDEFTIGKANGIATVKVGDIIQGETLKVTYDSPTNGTSNVKIYYKAKNATDDKYSTNAPIEAGEYIVKAVFPENEYYLETIVTAEFKISKANTPQYSITGTKGKNSFYISDVTIKAPSGYTISTDRKYFTDSIVFTESTNGVGIYFKNSSTGIISDRVAVGDILIDKEKPLIDGTDNKTIIYADSVEISISDENLEKVTLNGVRVNFQNGKTSLSLESKNSKKAYEIIATDKAGHETVVKVTVAAKWLENKVIPAGQTIILNAGEEYALPDGNWTITGDDTVYTGGMKIYVAKDTELVFTRQ